MKPIKIKELRNIHGMRQQDLAEALNISQQTISRYENGKHYPDVPALIEIADYFDVPLDYLVGRRWPKGQISELYVKKAMEYGSAESDDMLVSGENGAEARIKADMMHIVSMSRASEALSHEILDLSELSPGQAAHMREIYDTMILVKNTKTK